MKRLHPTIVLYGALCLIFVTTLTAEIATIFLANAKAKTAEVQTERLAAKERSFGPLAATKEDLENCVAGFEDDQGRATPPSVEGKARMTLELSSLLAHSGLEEGAASNAATTLVNAPEAAYIATFLAQTDGARLRDITAKTDDSGRHFTFDVTCAEDVLPVILSTLAGNTSGIALDALDMRGNGQDALDLRLEFMLPEGKETAK
jgi:hypothetical protein